VRIDLQCVTAKATKVRLMVFSFVLSWNILKSIFFFLFLKKTLFITQKNRFLISQKGNHFKINLGLFIAPSTSTVIHHRINAYFPIK
jgi:hypothetical protein